MKPRSPTGFRIRNAATSDLGALSVLFDGYRQFYKQPSDLGAAKAFLSERFSLSDSTLFVACINESELIGFTQLFPSFSSVLMRRIFVLNDLFVDSRARRSGVGAALLAAAHDYARAAGAARVSLKTAVDNVAGQRLYESLGYRRDEAFYVYDLSMLVG